MNAQRIVCDETCKLSDAPPAEANSKPAVTATTAKPTQTMPGGGYATVQIELPRNWDKLMTELGYQPLKEFYVK